MPRLGFIIAAICTGLVLAGCGSRATGVGEGQDEARAASGDSVLPPTPTAIQSTSGALSLSGQAAPGSRVRLGTPTGEAMYAGADDSGRWRLALGPISTPQVYGLSATDKSATAQAQGYLLVAPQGQAALLRAGAAAWRIDQPSGLGLRSLDFDRAGAASVSVQASPRASVVVHVDGAQVAQGVADGSGRFEVAAAAPIRPGLHRLQAYGDGFNDQVTVEISAPLAQGPLRSQMTSAGLRADWVTPGGGVQSTILLH